MKRIAIFITTMLTMALVFTGCGSRTSDEAPKPDVSEVSVEQEDQESVTEVDADSSEESSAVAENEQDSVMLAVLIDGEPLDVTWEENESLAALGNLVLATGRVFGVQMSRYGGFEQVGSLGADLPTSDEQTTTQAGDIMLYQGNQIVVFYGSNSWNYTRLGRIEGKSAEELEQLLGQHDTTLTLTLVVE